MSDCIFCKIVSGEIKADIVYQDNKILAFNDINPQAPYHILVIPKEHYNSIIDVPLDKLDIIEDIHKVIQIIAREKGLDKTGFRIVNNCGADGGQTVLHLHFHILGGRNMMWPPG